MEGIYMRFCSLLCSRALCGACAVSHHGLFKCTRVPDWDTPILQEQQQLPNLGLKRVLVRGLLTEQFGGGPNTWFG